MLCWAVGSSTWNDSLLNTLLCFLTIYSDLRTGDGRIEVLTAVLLGEQDQRVRAAVMVTLVEPTCQEKERQDGMCSCVPSKQQLHRVPVVKQPQEGSQAWVTIAYELGKGAGEVVNCH